MQLAETHFHVLWAPLFFSATQLKPDEGTPELPEGRVRVRLETDGTLHDVMDYEVEKVKSFFGLAQRFAVMT